MEAILRDVLCRGLADNEIQMDLLGDSNQDMTLEQVLRFVEAKEAGKRSAAHLLIPQATDHVAGSPYKRQKKPPPRNQQGPDQDSCTYCGTKGHGKNAPTRTRRSECPAFGMQYSHCSRDHHYERVCRTKHNKKPYGTEQENAIFDTICDLISKTNAKADTLDHHIYNKTTRSWSRRQSKPQPFVRLQMCTTREDYDHFGYPLKTTHAQTPVYAMADTGCQSCQAGSNIVKKLGLSPKDLIPVTLKMHAANSNNIAILGAAIIRLSGNGKSSRQIVYVTNATNKLFISRETCVDLGIIRDSFPLQPADTQSTKAKDTANHTNAVSAMPTPHQCQYPRRTTPPILPSCLPFPATDVNRKKLQDHILALYRSSTFNTCEHQTLPLMEGRPMRLMIDPSATPTAHHSPTPVPLHWQEEVKAGLDRDVRLGVIQQVPVDDPVTWWHCMVICAKKNGSLRRTIDFQPLNAHATRETHHMQSPFHQARSVPQGMKKTVFDAWNGYHSMNLHHEDRHYTTFITPWGRYRYRTAPQGYIASGDGYTSRYDEVVSSIPNKTKCIDDTLLWSLTIEECFFQACRWLDTCGRHGITLNPDKSTSPKRTSNLLASRLATTP